MQVHTHALTDTKYIPTWGGEGQLFLYIKIEINNFLGIVKWLGTKNMLQYISLNCKPE